MDCKFLSDARKLADGWLGLLPGLGLNPPQIQNEVAVQRAAHNQSRAALPAGDENHVLPRCTDEMEEAVPVESTKLQRRTHQDLFPVFPRLLALIFIFTADHLTGLHGRTETYIH